MAESFSPNEKHIKIFFAVDEAGTFKKAAELLKDQDIDLSAARIGQIIREGFNATYGPVFRQERDRWVITEQGRFIRSELRGQLDSHARMRGTSSETHKGLPQIACLPHHILFIGELESLLMAQEPVGQPKIAIETLPQSHRATAEFAEWALDPLVRGQYFMVIGPPPPGDVAYSNLVTELIYTPRLEALVHRDFEADHMSLEHLVERELLVPPRSMRSRTMLDDEIRKAGLPDPALHRRIINDSYETVANFFRVLAEHYRPPEQRKVLVVPSDVALKFKTCLDARAVDYKWVPLRRRDGSELTHPVNLTTGAARSGVVFTAVELLKKVTSEMQAALTGQQVVMPRDAVVVPPPLMISPAPQQRRPDDVSDPGTGPRGEIARTLTALADHLTGKTPLTERQMRSITDTTSTFLLDALLSSATRGQTSHEAIRDGAGGRLPSPPPAG